MGSQHAHKQTTLLKSAQSIHQQLKILSRNQQPSYLCKKEAATTTTTHPSSFRACLQKTGHHHQTNCSSSSSATAAANGVALSPARATKFGNNGGGTPTSTKSPIAVNRARYQTDSKLCFGNILKKQNSYTKSRFIQTQVIPPNKKQSLMIGNVKPVQLFAQVVVATKENSNYNKQVERFSVTSAAATAINQVVGTSGGTQIINFNNQSQKTFASALSLPKKSRSSKDNEQLLNQIAQEKLQSSIKELLVIAHPSNPRLSVSQIKQKLLNLVKTEQPQFDTVLQQMKILSNQILTQKQLQLLKQQYQQQQLLSQHKSIDNNDDVFAGIKQLQSVESIQDQNVIMAGKSNGSLQQSQQQQQQQQQSLTKLKQIKKCREQQNVQNEQEYEGPSIEVISLDWSGAGLGSALLTDRDNHNKNIQYSKSKDQQQDISKIKSSNIKVQESWTSQLSDRVRCSISD